MHQLAEKLPSPDTLFQGGSQRVAHLGSPPSPSLYVHFLKVKANGDTQCSTGNLLGKAGGALHS